MSFAAGQILVDANDQIWICTVAGTPGTWVAAKAVTTTPAGTELKRLEYDPATNTNLTRSSTVYVTATATNLKLNFVAPASGNIGYRLEWTGMITAGGALLICPYITGLGNRGHFAVVTELTKVIRLRYETTITGLTPGTSYTIQPGYEVSSGTSTWFAGGAQGSILQVVTAA